MNTNYLSEINPKALSDVYKSICISNLIKLKVKTEKNIKSYVYWNIYIGTFKMIKKCNINFSYIFYYF